MYKNLKAFLQINSINANVTKKEAELQPPF